MIDPSVSDELVPSTETAAPATGAAGLAEATAVGATLGAVTTTGWLVLPVAPSSSVTVRVTV